MKYDLHYAYGHYNNRDSDSECTNNYSSCVRIISVTTTIASTPRTAITNCITITITEHRPNQ